MTKRDEPEDFGSLGEFSQKPNFMRPIFYIIYQWNIWLLANVMIKIISTSNWIKNTNFK